MALIRYFFLYHHHLRSTQRTFVPISSAIDVDDMWTSHKIVLVSI